MNWISTKRELPDRGDRRQFLAIHEKLGVGFLLNYTAPYADPYWAFTPDHIWYSGDLSQVTYWMPFPESTTDVLPESTELVGERKNEQ